MGSPQKLMDTAGVLAATDPDADTVRYLFGSHVVDVEQMRLLRAGSVVPLEPKVFEVLRYLVRHHERVVTKDELLQQVWRGEVVTEAVLPNNVAVLRRALGQGRGQAEPIETVHGRGYRFTATVRCQGRAGASPGTGSPPGLIGREVPMSRLSHRLGDARAGRGRFCLLDGPAGIGKTRLVEQVVMQALGAGASVWTGRCYDGDGAPPLWPWVQVLRACAEDSDPALWSGAAGQERDLLLEWVADPSRHVTAGRAGLDSATHRFQHLDAAVRFIVRSSAERTRLVWLEDLHLADVGSLQMLELLATQLGRSRLLVLATMRTDELPANHAHQELILRLVRARGAEHIVLDGLTRTEAEAYLCSLRDTALSPWLASELWRLCDGNPYFMREALEGMGPEPSPTGEFELRLSASAHAVMRRRLGRASTHLKALLRVACVIGDEIRLPLLVRVADMPNDELLDALDEAVELQILVPLHGEPGGYRFAQASLCHALYSDLRSTRRAALHARIAAVLTGQVHGTPERLRQVAHHLHRALPAGDCAEAAACATRAALAAAHGGDFLQAARMYQLALDSFAFDVQPHSERRCRVQVEQGRLLWLAGHRERAAGVLRVAMDDCRGAAHGAVLAEAALALVEMSTDPLAPDMAAQGALREALGDSAAGASPVRGVLLAHWATMRADDATLATRGFDDALEPLVGADAEVWRCRAELARVRFLLLRSEHRECALAAEALAVRLEKLRQRAGLAIPLEPLTWADWLSSETARLHCQAVLALGHTSVAERAYQSWGALTEHYHQPAMRQLWLIYGAEQALGRGQLAAARALLDEVGAGAAANPGGQLAWWCQVFRIRIAMLQGEAFPDAAQLESLEAQLERGEDWRRPTLGWLAARASGRALALRMLDASLAAALARSVPSLWELCALAECVARVGHREGALALRDSLAKTLQPMDVVQVVGPLFQCFGSPRRHLGVLEQFLGRSARAREHLQAAVEADAAVGLTVHALGCRFALARLLAEQKAQNLRTRGAKLMAATAAEASEHGLVLRDAPVVSGAPTGDGGAWR